MIRVDDLREMVRPEPLPDSALRDRDVLRRAVFFLLASLTSAETSSSLRIECQPLIPCFLAMAANCLAVCDRNAFAEFKSTHLWML